jgi:hypothetical protein
MWSFDTICVEFQVGEKERVEIREDMADFTNVTEQMQEEFPQVPKDWYSEVLQPAFADNERVLWCREQDAG